MAGREDFGILRSEIMTDRRVHRAADLLVQRGLAVEATSFPTVCGYIGLLGLWAMRETDNGVLPDDGVLPVQLATTTTRSVAQEIVRVLVEVTLLRPEDAGLYLAGFEDCYKPIVDRREANKEAKALERAEAAAARAERAKKLAASGFTPKTNGVRRTSRGRHDDVMQPSVTTDRAVPAVPSASERNGTAGSLDSHPVVSGGAALASDAAAAPPSATVGERNGTTAAPLKYQRCAAHQIRQPCGVCEIAEQAAKRRLEGATASSTVDIASRVRSQIAILANAATPPTADVPKNRIEPPPDDAEFRKRIRAGVIETPPSPGNAPSGDDRPSA